MARTDQNVSTEMQNPVSPATDVTAALTDLYNRTAVKAPPDPWVAPEDAAESETEALDDLYND